MVDTRRSAAAKRPAAEEDQEEEKAAAAAPAAAAAGEGAGAPASAGRRPAKRGKAVAAEVDCGKEDEEAASASVVASAADATPVVVGGGGAAVPPLDTAGLQALTGAVDRLEAILRPGEAVSNSAGHKRSALAKDLQAKLKEVKDLADGVAKKRLPPVANRRQEPWCRLISQHAKNPSIPINASHFTVGYGAHHNLRLEGSYTNSLVCRLKHAKRGALLEIYESKVVRVNGKSFDKTNKVTYLSNFQRRNQAHRHFPLLGVVFSRGSIRLSKILRIFFHLRRPKIIIGSRSGQ
uniref:FHA domain-containing protein n=1 Tax=Oryza meridionalis TaxID=40149 RepID=A0A0E0D0C2_9ORYZ